MTTQGASRSSRLAIASIFIGCSFAPNLHAIEDPPAATTQPAEPEGVALLMREAAELRKIIKGKAAREMIDAVDALPTIAPRTLYLDRPNKNWLTKAEAEKLDADARAKLEETPIDETRYYYTKYGTPLAYARVLDILDRHGLVALTGSRIMDFGYGTIGQLRMMAARGADAVGVEVDSFLNALYCDPSDTGRMTGQSGRDGRVTLVHGRWPAEDAVKAKAGGGFDVITSKNTLKNGFFHPTQPVPPDRLMNLGVDDTTFVKALYDALKPGGLMIIYNICPAPSKPGEPYKHWADGKCPFPRDMWKKAGFEIIAFDEDDTPFVRKMAVALGWDKGEHPMDIENDLFAEYTLVRKPRS